MKPDAYTKLVLTVIAACLVVLALDTLLVTPRARAASSDPQAVYIVGVQSRFGSLPVRIVDSDGNALSTLPVSIAGSRGEGQGRAANAEASAPSTEKAAPKREKPASGNESPAPSSEKPVTPPQP